MEQGIIDIAIAALTALFVVMWWLIRSKVRQIELLIDTLFKRHDIDVEKLQNFRIEVAGAHYVKPELDAKFDRMEKLFTDSLNSLNTTIRDLGNKIDRYTESLSNGRQ